MSEAFEISSEDATESTETTEEVQTPTEGEGTPAGEPAAPEVVELTDEFNSHGRRVKIDGEEKFVTAEEAFKNYQLEKASRQRLQEAHKIRQEADQRQQQFQQDPLSHLRQLKEQGVKLSPHQLLEAYGHDPRQFSEEHLIEQLNQQQLSPHEQQIKDLQSQLDQRERQDHQRQQEEAFQEKEQRIQGEVAKLQAEISTAWKETGMPENSFYSQRVGHVMRESFQKAQNGEIFAEEVLNAGQASDIVLKEHWETTRQSLDELTPEQLFDKLGEGVFKKVRAYELKRVSSPTPKTETKPDGPTESVASQSRKRPLTEEEWEAFKAQPI